MDNLPVPPHHPPPICAQVIRVSDVDEMRALFSSWQGRFEQFTSGRFQGTIQLVIGSLVRIFSTEANQRMQLRGHDAGGLISFYLVTGSCVPCIWQGRRLDLGPETARHST